MNVSNFYRIFLGCLLGLCCAIFPVSVNASYVWDEVRSDFKQLKTDVDRNFRNMVSTSRGVVVTQEGKIVGSVAADNAMQVNSTVKYTGPQLSARSNSVLRYGANTVKAGAAACLRAPVRCNLVGLGVGAGIGALLDSIDAVIDGDNISRNEIDLEKTGGYLPPFKGSVTDYPSPRVLTSRYDTSGHGKGEDRESDALAELNSSLDGKNIFIYNFSTSVEGETYYARVRGCDLEDKSVGEFLGLTQWYCVFSTTGSSNSLDIYSQKPLSNSQIDALAENFELDNSDLPTVGAVVLGSQPTTIDLEPTEPVKISDSKQFNEDGSYSERERSGRYAVSRSGTAAPRVEYVEKEVKKDFDDLGNEVGESSTEYRDYAQPPSDRPAVPVVDVDIPTGCALFDPFCQWAKWTQQDLGEEDPDLSVLINEFEPEEDAYSINLGAAQCPAPIDINLSFFNTDLQLSYEPICDFLALVRPLILASAYLLAAYIYLGVLRG